MGKLNKIEEKDTNVKVHYTKLQDEDSGSCDSFQVMPTLSEYLSYTCKHCGHTQAFQGKGVQTEMKRQQLYQGNDMYLNAISRPLVKTRPSAISESHRYNVLDSSISEAGQMNSFRRMIEKPSLIKQIGKGLTVNVNDEEVCSLVTDGSSSTPGSQTNIPTLVKVDEMEDLTKTINTSVDNELGFQDKDDLKYDLAESAQKSSIFSIEALKNKGDDLKLAPWYQEGIPREIALEILSQEPIGSFMVRKSTTKIGCYALSVRVPRSFQLTGIAHYLIMKTKNGYRIKGFTKEFTTLVSLITHHSVMPELLPCPLSLSRYHPIFVISDSRRDFADVKLEPEYNSHDEFRKSMDKND